MLARPARFELTTSAFGGQEPGAAGPLNNAPDYDVAACITRLNCLDGSVVVGVSVMPPISRLGLVQLPSWRWRNANVPALDVCNGVTSSNLYVP
jgi:hypothetical protein